MGDLSVRVDIQKLLSFGDDLIGVLNNEKDVESLKQSMEGGKMLGAATQGDAQQVQASLEEYQKRIGVCKENIDKTKRGTVPDAEIEHLQSELEEKLQRESSLCEELRAIHEELDGLERQRVSIEEQKELVKKREKDLLRAQNLLSMCASVTNIIPILDDQTKISGFVVDRNMKRAEKFELDNDLPSYETSNRLWEMASSG
ncbi:uncharacterized protein LOC109845550 [Asparagus officinalis]|uniref:uncharacterized protein LOC109845550 n=1 Tax=Asparagus officinalis TaxID=4686 RepID=UPI00098E2FD0|nr:uncharacterized protein LOC109845550 [Asparagus officinalis]